MSNDPKHVRTHLLQINLSIRIKQKIQILHCFSKKEALHAIIWSPCYISYIWKCTISIFCFAIFFDGHENVPTPFPVFG